MGVIDVHVDGCVAQKASKLAVNLVGLLLQPYLDGLKADVLLLHLLLMNEELYWDAEAVEKDDDLSVEVALTECGASHNFK